VEVLERRYTLFLQVGFRAWINLACIDKHYMNLCLPGKCL